MPVFNNALAGAAGSAGGADAYKIERSLRFNKDDSAYLSKTPSSAGNRRKFTLSTWVKRSGLGNWSHILTAGPNSGYWDSIRFNQSDQLSVALRGNNAVRTTDAVFRDVSAWYHIVVAVDTTQATDSQRVKIYVNGVEQSLTGSNIGVDKELSVNDTTEHRIGLPTWNTTENLDGYLAEFHFIDGQRLAPTDFGEFDADTGIWNPIEYDGTYGTNGYYLDYAQTGGSKYSDLVTIGNNTGSITAASAANGFDGSLSTTAYGDTNSSQPRYTPATAIPQGSSVRVVLVTGNSTGRVSDSTGSLAAGTSGTGGASGSAADLTFTAPRDIDYLQFSLDDNGYGGFKLIAIDGVTLLDANPPGVDASGSNNNWVGNNFSMQSDAYTAIGYRENTGSTNRNWNDSSTANATSSLLNEDTIFWVDLGESVTTNLITFDVAITGTDTNANNYFVYYSTNPNSTGTNTFNTFNRTPGGTSGSFSMALTSGSTITARYFGVANGNGGTSAQFTYSNFKIHPAGKDIDSLLDSPTNYEAETGNNVGNYATWNPLTLKGVVSTSNGSLTADTVTNGTGWVVSSLPVNSGKYYCEISFGNIAASHNTNFKYIGIVPTDSQAFYTGNDIFRASGALAIDSNGTSFIRGTIGTGGSETTNTYQSNYGFDENDVIGIAIDCDTPQVTFYKNGVSTGTFPHAMQANKSWVVFMNDWASGYTDIEEYFFNAGQRPFAFAPPTGFKSMCTQNLPDTLIADGSTAMNVVTYTGDNNSSRTITTGLSPDLVWLKTRNNQGGDWSHRLFDTVRGIDLGLSTNSTNGEENRYTATCGGVHAFTSDGFTLSQSGGNVPCHNATGNSMVAWTWDGGNLATNSAYNQSDVWSNRCTGTVYSASLGYKNAFDGSTSTASHSANGNTITFTPATAISVSSSIKIYYDIGSITGTTGTADITINGTSYVATAHSNRSNGHFTVTGVSSITSIVWERAADNDLIAVKAIEVDGKMLVDAGVVPVGSLNSSAYDQSQTWSSTSNLSGSYRSSNDQYGPPNMFNGIIANESTTGGQCFSAFSSNSSMTWTSPVTYNNLTSLRLFVDKSGTGDGFLRVNGNNYDSSVTDGWVTIPETSLSTIQFGYTDGTNTATGVGGVEVNGILLVDSGASVTNVPSVAATVRANPTAGFSIVTAEFPNYYTNYTVPHGLNSTPHFIVGKNRLESNQWDVYHQEVGTGKLFRLNQTSSVTNATANQDSYYPTAPDSNVFGFVGNNSNMEFIWYVFSEVKGYSKFGKFKGNGDTDGPFVYTGFRPALIIVKRTNGTARNWVMIDATRSTSNEADEGLYPNLSNAEDTGTDWADIVSNGFKTRNNNASWNTSNTEYVYFAWAENPFKIARAR